jgi:hypothetical protein
MIYIYIEYVTIHMIHIVCEYTNFYILVLRYNYNISKNRGAFEIFYIYFLKYLIINI